MTPERIIEILIFFGKLTCTWPPDDNHIKHRRMVNDFKLFFMLINVIGLLIPLMLGVYYNSHHLSAAMKAASESTTMCDVLLNLLLCRAHKNRLRVSRCTYVHIVWFDNTMFIITICVTQSLLAEVSNYSNTIKGDEKQRFKKSIDRYLPFCTFVGVLYLQTAMAFCCGPLVTQSLLPADTWYPFPIEIFSTGYFLLYIQHVFTIMHTGMCITVDFMVALLLSYLVARLQTLKITFRKAGTVRDLNACIQQHRDIIR